MVGCIDADCGDRSGTAEMERSARRPRLIDIFAVASTTAWPNCRCLRPAKSRKHESRSMPRRQRRLASGRSSARSWPDDPSLVFHRQEIVKRRLPRRCGGAVRWPASCWCFSRPSPEKMPGLLKEIGEAYYRWHPKKHARHRQDGGVPGRLAARGVRGGGHPQHDRLGPSRRAFRFGPALGLRTRRRDHRRVRLGRAARQRQGVYEGRRGGEMKTQRWAAVQSPPQHRVK